MFKRVQALQEDKQKLLMETPELYSLAKNEIIAEAEKEEASKQILVLKVEESELNQQCQNILRNMNEHHERQLVADKACANKIIGKIHRMFQARKKIRQKCLEVFKKRFDERYHSYYYINLHSGKTSWEKPKIFGSGSFDIEPEDEWIILRDSHDFPYYFNPKTMRMCWEPPLGVLMCQNTISYTWWKLDPVPKGRCINFAMTQCHEDGLLYCQDCWVCKSK
jgi:hypothetical protein